MEAFPDMSGLASRNLLALKVFAREYYIRESLAQTQLTDSLPAELRGSLPTVEEIGAELAKDILPVGPTRGGES